MTSDETRALQAMASLQGDPNFKTFMGWLEARREKARANEQVRDDVLLRWQQGRAQECNDIIEVVTTARDVLMKVRK